MQERTDRCEHPCRGQRRLQCTDAPAKSGSRKFADFFLQGGLPIRESRLTRWDRFVYTQSRRRECCDHIPAWERVSPAKTWGQGSATSCRPSGLLEFARSSLKGAQADALCYITCSTRSRSMKKKNCVAMLAAGLSLSVPVWANEAALPL